jgi:hypothetical protein
LVETDPDEEELFQVPSRRDRLTMDELPPMPGYPEGETGRLVAVSDGDFPINGAWRAEAGICLPFGTLELYTDDLTNGTVIVLHFPDSQVAGTYTVLPADTGLSEERIARVGAQVFRADQEAFGFRAVSGHLELSEQDGHLSGRFQSTLSEIQTELLTRYVGVFLRVPLRALPDHYCAAMADSLRVTSANVDSAGISPTEDEGGS